MAGDDSGRPRSRGPVRGRSDADIEVHEVEDDERVEYLEDADEVRYVSGWTHSTPWDQLGPDEHPEREPTYATTPAERWGKTRCLEAAARAAEAHAGSVLGTDEVTWWIGIVDDGTVADDDPATVTDDDRAAGVEVGTVLSRSGEIASDVAVDFEALVAATPRTVSASYELDERFECHHRVPVYARHAVMQHD